MANRSAGRPPRPRKSKKANQFINKNGKAIALHRSLSERWQARRDAKLARKAEMLRTMPKSRIKRFFYRLHPKRLYKYWFSREGAIMALKITGIAIIVMFVLTVGVFAYFRKDLPNVKDISGNNIGGSILYYDRTGQTLLWEDHDGAKRIPVPGDQIAQVMKDATVAIEDRDFYKHGGFDMKGIVRAGWANLTGGSTSQGGSTITQQLVKLTQDWTKDRSYTRKIKELILSIELERTYSKDEILTGYLNTAPYGGTENGVEAAAQDYFKKSAKDLTLDEAAFLATIPKSPYYYSPYSDAFDKPAFTGREHYVLDTMVQTGKISKQQADEAKKVDVLAKVKPRETKYAGIKAPYFVLAAKSELESVYGQATVNRGGWKVTTTINMDLQALAEKAVADNMKNVQRAGGDTSAFAAEDVKTGQMVALVGGPDFNNETYGKINYAHDAMIPPGSSFKPYDYAALIENTTNFGAGSVLYDTQGPLEGYPCTDKGAPPPRGHGNCLQDYDFRYPGPLTLRYALGGSRNVPAVKAMLTAGVNKTIDMASAMMGNANGYNCYADEKFTQETQCYGASAIGDGAFLHLDDHVNGLATFARLGQVLPRTYIYSITDSGGKSVKKWSQPKSKQVIRPDTAYILNDMASDPRASYLPAGDYKFHRYKGWNFAVKTGTTNNGFDGLMASWSTQYAAVSWVGYHTRNKSLSGTMEVLTAPITRTWMRAAHDKLNTTPVNWTKPSTVKTMPAFIVRSHVGVGSQEPSPSDDLFPSWYVGNNKTSNQPVTIDVVSNKLASECTPELAKKTQSTTDANAFSGDRFVPGGGGNNTGEKDDIHKCTDSRPSLSNLSVTSSGGGRYTFSVDVAQGTFALSDPARAQFPGTVNFLIDGQIVQSVTVNGNGTATASNWSATVTGDHTVSAQVIDSVLYDGTIQYSSNPYSFTGGGGSGVTITSPDNGDDTGATATLAWTGGSGTAVTRLDGVVIATCTHSPCNNIPIPGSNGSSHTFTVTDGSDSDSVTFTR